MMSRRLTLHEQAVALSADNFMTERGALQVKASEELSRAQLLEDADAIQGGR